MGNSTVVALGLGSMIIGGAFIITEQFVQASPELQQSKLKATNIGIKGIGESCGESIECSSTGTKGGPGSQAGGQIGCCNGICRRKKKGELGIYWCPEDRPDLPQVNEEIKELKTSGRTDLLESTKGIGQDCSTFSECSSTGIAGDPKSTGRLDINGTVLCCNGKCRFGRRDYLGDASATWCPEDCRGTIFGTTGSCKESYEEVRYNELRKNNKRAVSLGSYVS